VRLRILNNRQTLLHSFTYRKIHRFTVDIPSDDPLWDYGTRKLGTVYTYELTLAGKGRFRNEWLLDSGGTILVDFEKIVYRRHRLRTALRN
jgi:hypothetical protein